MNIEMTSECIGLILERGELFLLFCVSYNRVRAAVDSKQYFRLGAFVWHSRFKIIEDSYCSKTLSTVSISPWMSFELLVRSFDFSALISTQNIVDDWLNHCVRSMSSCSLPACPLMPFAMHNFVTIRPATLTHPHCPPMPLVDSVLRRHEEHRW